MIESWLFARVVDCSTLTVSFQPLAACAAHRRAGKTYQTAVLNLLRITNVSDACRHRRELRMLPSTGQHTSFLRSRNSRPAACRAWCLLLAGYCVFLLGLHTEKFYGSHGVVPRALVDVATQKPNLVLTYAGGSLDIKLFNIFLRSLRATGSSAVVIVFVADFVPSKQADLLASVYGAKFLRVDPSLRKRVAWYGKPVMFRFHIWRSYLNEHVRDYCNVLNTDLDVYFQRDPFECFFSQECHLDSESLHVFAENPVFTLATCPQHKSWYLESCQAIDGASKLAQHGNREIICAGFTIGSAKAHLAYLNQMDSTIERTNGICNDQAIHNMLVWGNVLNNGIKVYVWDYFRGPVKTIDTGYIRDELGHIVNERGLPYCVVHQFKEDRSGIFFQELMTKFPLYSIPERLHMEDTRFPVCTRVECHGLRVHTNVQRMIDMNITAGWRGELPAMQRMNHLQAQRSGFDIKAYYAITVLA